MSTPIRSEIRILIAKYGLANVHSEFQAELRDTYDFLRGLFDPPKNNLVIPVAETIPDRIATPHARPMTDTLIPVIPELCLSEEETTESIALSDLSIKEIVIQAKKESLQEGTAIAEKFSKAKHKEEVLKKRKELEDQGIKPESLLTKENLTKWLGQGMSYMKIAREHVGVPENEVAAAAKTFGLQSDMRKYIVMKKK
jgi:hypothetical protein